MPHSWPPLSSLCFLSLFDLLSCIYQLRAPYLCLFFQCQVSVWVQCDLWKHSEPLVCYVPICRKHALWPPTGETIWVQCQMFSLDCSRTACLIIRRRLLESDGTVVLAVISDSLLTSTFAAWFPGHCSSWNYNGKVFSPPLLVDSWSRLGTTRGVETQDQVREEAWQQWKNKGLNILFQMLLEHQNEHEVMWNTNC